MATLFAEPGGDATFNVATTGAGGFWGNASAILETDIVHGGHKRSIGYATGSAHSVTTPIKAFLDTGSRVSFYIYIKTLPTSTAGIISLQTINAGTTIITLALTSGGVLQFISGLSGSQFGSNGATLTTGRWYRISFAFTITDTTHNRFEQFVDGVSSISLTNVTLAATSSIQYAIGNVTGDATLDIRTSDHYYDDSSALTDPGNIWVTAKRPFSNGAANNFTTQIGSGGSGYGSGHAPQVNERPLSTTNGWSMVGAGNAVTEEYTIETASAGDINVERAVIVDLMGWMYVNVPASGTPFFVVAGTSFALGGSSGTTMFTQAAAVKRYPTGGTDIGVITSTTLVTSSLYECGVMVVYIPATANDMLSMFQ